mmetsp:Transcript_11711/g.15905  ORF Transcript_11711/g.15905 Transcript_11711/m.15905 type:complete len:81 (+) Transcript_11711:652-894(+)
MLAKVEVYSGRDSANKGFADQYGAARVTFLDFTAVPELEIYWKPLSKLPFDTLTLQCLLIDLGFVEAEHVRLSLVEEFDE